MKLVINKDRTTIAVGTWGTENENNYEVLHFEFPQELQNYNKRIVYYLGDEKVWDAIVDDKAYITNAITKYEKVKAYVWCTKTDDDIEKDIDFRTKLFEMNFYENDNADGIVPTEEQVDGFNTMLTAMNNKIQEINDIEETIETNETERQAAEAERERKTDEAIDNIVDMTEAYNQNATQKTNDFNDNATQKTNDFNANYTQKVNDFDTATDTILSNKEGQLDAYEHAKEVELNSYTGTKKAELDSYENSKETEINNYVNTKKTEINTYTGTKKTELDTYEGAKETELNTYASGLKDDFDTNATNKTNAFNTNATSKTTEFDNNATAKTTAFDENAEEKTGEFNNNVTSKTDEFDAHVTEKEAEFDANVEQIQQDITDIQEFIDSELEQETTEKSTRADITNAAKWYSQLSPTGRTEQNSTTQNANLFDENYYNNDDLYAVDVYKYTKSRIIGNRRLYIKAQLKDGGVEQTGLYACLSSTPNPNTSGAVYQMFITNGRPNVLLLNATEVETLYFCFYFPSNSVNKIFDNYNLWVSTDSISYVPFVPDSPSPAYPQEIRNVEGRSCTNMFDIQAFENQLITHKILNDSGVEVVDSGSSYSKYKILLKANQTYYLKGAWQRIYYYDLEGNFKSRSTNHNGFSMAYAPTEDEYIGLQIGDTYWNNNHGTEQINESSTAMPYEPYFEGKRLEFNVCNKNLINPNNILNYGIVPNKHEAQRYNGRNAYLISAKANTTYTFSRASVGTASYSYLAIFDEFIIEKNNSYTNAKNISNGLVDTVTTTENTKYIMFFSGTGISENVQIEESTIATSYEEHNQQLIPFPLAEGQKLMEGSYLAEDGVHYNYAQKILNGTEEWQILSSAATYTQFSIARSALPNAKVRGKVLSNYFIQTKNDRAEFNNVYVGNNYFNVCLDNTVEATVEGLKSWLADKYNNNNPVIIQYETSSELVEPYTEAQAEAYNKLKNLMLYKGVNHIWTETDGLEPNLQLTYYKSNKERLNNIEARLELLEN